MITYDVIMFDNQIYYIAAGRWLHLMVI